MLGYINYTIIFEEVRLAWPFWNMSHVTGDEKKQVQEEGSQKIRLTVTSSKLPNLQKVCDALVRKLKQERRDVRGPVPMPRRRLRITTRRAPCGNGTETYDHFELRVYKRVIDFRGTPAAVKQITTIGLEPEVHVEVTILE